MKSRRPFMSNSKAVPRSNSRLLALVGVVAGVMTTWPHLLLLPNADGLSITTFNMLAAVHRSVPNLIGAETPYVEPGDFRESDCESWWRPRAKNIAMYIAEELSSSDVILLQEWWTRPDFVELFDEYTGHLFGRVSHRRPGLVKGKPREDGMAVLVNKKSRLEMVDSNRIVTAPGRIAQIVHFREKNAGRSLFVGNAHLSFPGGQDPVKNERRQAYEVHLVARALARTGLENSFYGDDGSHLEILAGDFNSNSRALASCILERHPYHFANCMSAKAFQSMASSVGGEIDLGVTHRTHLGQEVSVDHLFARIVRSNGNPGMTNGLLKLGYLDSTGAQVVDCQKKHISFENELLLSDHRPVTARLDWDRKSLDLKLPNTQESNVLHPLQSPWDS
eukprot:scaffold7101_cov153-Amphora_coffeaeformis.AAC.10